MPPFLKGHKVFTIFCLVSLLSPLYDSMTRKVLIPTLVERFSLTGNDKAKPT